MNKTFSVIIPTYKEPAHLDLCLRSCIEGAAGEPEIIVVVDGFYDLNKEVLRKYPEVKIINFERNKGLSIATNLGVYYASNEFILIVNDDNVFPHNWDQELSKDLAPRRVLTPNQIEPSPSIFSQFIIENLGVDPTIFDLKRFWEREKKLRQNIIDNSGTTLPFAMGRVDFLMMGGWDELYPSPHVVDVDFFLKCQYFQFDMQRTYKANFYHFGCVATRSTPESDKLSSQKEYAATQFYHNKWGFFPRRDPLTNRMLND